MTMPFSPSPLNFFPHLPQSHPSWAHLRPLSFLLRGTLIPTHPTSTSCSLLNPNSLPLIMLLPSMLVFHPPFGKLPQSTLPLLPYRPPQSLYIVPWTIDMTHIVKHSISSSSMPSLVISPPIPSLKPLTVSPSSTNSSSLFHRGDMNCSILLNSI